MTVALLPALASGVLGGAAMVALGLLMRSNRFDIAGMWADLLALGSGSRAGGLVVHVAVSAAIGVLYALGFRLAEASDAGLIWGLVASVLHWLVAGLFLAVRRPDDSPGASPPAAFGSDLGSGVAVGFLIAHLVYGAVFGAAYFALHPAGGLGAAL